jgi:hypothetical protein
MSYYLPMKMFFLFHVDWPCLRKVICRGLLSVHNPMRAAPSYILHAGTQPSRLDPRRLLVVSIDCDQGFEVDREVYAQRLQRCT